MSKDCSGSDEAFFVPKDVLDEIKELLVHGLPADESKAISKKFVLDYEDQSFSIKPPKLDSFMVRRAKNANRSRAGSLSEESLVSTQLKIMDIAPPLIELYAQICSLGEGEAEKQAKGTAQAILRQWGRAYYHFSQRRRHSVVSLVDPTFEHLLSSGSEFVPGKKALELLFTSSFLKSMLKEAEQDVTFANSPAKRASRSEQSTRELRPRRAEPVSYYPNVRTRGRLMRPTAAANSWLRGGERYVDYSYKDSPKVSINYDKDHVRKVGARILDFAANWKQITDDGWVLDCVTEGVKFDIFRTAKTM